MAGTYTAETSNDKLVLDFPSPPTRHYGMIMAMVLGALMLPTFFNPNVHWIFKAMAFALLAMGGLALPWIYKPRDAQTVTVTEKSLHIKTGDEQKDIPSHYIEGIFVREANRLFVSERKVRANSTVNNDAYYGVVIESASEETVLAGHLTRAEQHRICDLINAALPSPVVSA